jgi:squalene synthase HpnC
LRPAQENVDVSVDPAPPPPVATDPVWLPSPSVVRRRAGAENFPVALGLLPRRTRGELLAIYDYARTVDQLGDDHPDGASGAVRSLDSIERDLSAVVAGGEPRSQVVAALAPGLRAGRLALDPLLRLLEANRQDQLVTRYRDFDDLVGYCRLSANPVGELVLAVFGQRTPERLALSDRICTALQVLEHCQDVAEDLRRGRIYLPKEDLDRFAVDEPALAGGGPAARALVGFEVRRAVDWLDRGASLVGTLHGWPRLAVAGFVAGGRATADALRDAGHDVWAGVPRPGRIQTARRFLPTFFRGR